MKLPHLLLAVLITAIWGINFSVIKLGLHAIDPFILASALRSAPCLPCSLSGDRMCRGAISSAMA